MILRGEILDGETVHINVVNNKIHIRPNHEVMHYDGEDLEDMDMDIEDLE